MDSEEELGRWNGDLKKRLTTHMRDFGLHMVAKGVVNATFSEMLNPYSHAMSIVHIAHGAEIIFKARIAEEHPLLIFSKLPKTTQVTGNMNIMDILENGQTIMYSELPDKLWAITGHRIEHVELFSQFGKIRNQIIHLTVPDIELDELALKFTFSVVETAINEWWDETILEYAPNYD